MMAIQTLMRLYSLNVTSPNCGPGFHMLTVSDIPNMLNSLYVEHRGFTLGNNVFFKIKIAIK